MKHLFKDAIQIVIAILITTSLVAVNAAPLKQKSVTKTIPVTKVAVIKAAPVPSKPAQEAVSAPQTTQPVAPAQTPVTQPVQASQSVYSGGHEDWMAAAGIAPSDYAAVDYIVSHESGWRIVAQEPHTGACGLVQELPCGKSGCVNFDTDGNFISVDPVCQLKWASNYAVSRYSSWWGAQSFWASNLFW